MSKAGRGSAKMKAGGFVFPEFQRGLMEYTRLQKIVEILAKEDVKLSRLHGDLPSLYMARDSIPCPLEQSGQTMRSLIEAFRDRQIDTIDGNEVYYDDTWVLMHPNSEEPIIDLFAEVPSKDAANRVIQEYAEKIRTLAKT